MRPLSLRALRKCVLKLGNAMPDRQKPIRRATCSFWRPCSFGHYKALIILIHSFFKFIGSDLGADAPSRQTTDSGATPHVAASFLERFANILLFHLRDHVAQ